ncbi:hypothetical protein [Hypericibacter sp.]|uniref:hypothetical protein n=1 Tax=Hypericibacter sp. TaxID=2705401 RepID=UPI003D6D8082
MRPFLLLPLILLALATTGCSGPTVTESSTDGVVVRELAVADNFPVLQAQADAECDKHSKIAHFVRYADETLLGPRNAYFDCVSP